jgi:hypothetical protein
MKTYKVWIEVDEHDSKTFTHERIGEPLDVKVPNQAAAKRLQTLLYLFSIDIQCHIKEFGKPPAPSPETYE